MRRTRTLTHIPWRRSAAALTCAAALVACNDETQPTASDVADDARQAAQSAGEYTTAQVDAFKAEMRSRMDDLNDRITALQERTAELGQSARSELESELETIRAMRDRLAQRVDELGETSGAAWSEVVSGAESAWTELSEAVASAAERFDTSPPGGV